MHHFGYYVDDIDGAITAMEAKGYPVVQSGAGFGVDGDGAFAYFDTTAGTAATTRRSLVREHCRIPTDTFPSDAQLRVRGSFHTGELAVAGRR